jgi:hypothetical protein
MSRGRIALVMVLALAITGGVLGTAYARSGSAKQDRQPQPNWNIPAADKSSGEKGFHWAALNPDGSTARHGKDWIASSNVNPPGGYGVAFKKSVQACGYVASIGSVVPSGAPSQGVAFPAPFGFGSVLPNAVYIDTKNQSNAFANLPTYLVVVC